MMDGSVSVRLVEWNVAMSLHTKTHLLAALTPDIAVLPESAHPDRLGDALAATGATSMQWIGTNPTKGLLVAAFGGWTLRIDDSYDPGYQWVMPLHVDGPAQIRMLAVWDMNHRGHGHDTARRLGACRASMEHYAEFLSGPADLRVISGDFNNSVYWDRPGAAVRFGDFMDHLESQSFVSAYHHRNGCARGAEPDPTLWWTRNADKPYHVDYTFVSPAAWVGTVTMGDQDDWLAHSDHSPMTIELQIATRHADTRSSMDKTDSPAKSTPLEAAKNIAGTVRKHFDLTAGELEDMICGNNGQNFTRQFRPSHFTADWANGSLTEVRIWGPQVRQDGTLAVRLLDHCWRMTRARGSIDYSILPRTVARRIREYTARDVLDAG